MTGAAPNERDLVQSLARGLAVIRSFSAERPQMTLSDVARATGLTRAAARRFLITLVELGYVRTDDRLFALTPRVLDLGFAYLSALRLPEVVTPHLEALVALADESASASVLDGSDIVYVARVFTRKIMSVNIQVGSRFPAASTSMGRAILAFLPATRRDDVLGRASMQSRTPFTVTDPADLAAKVAEVGRQGWALVDQELEVGLRSIAVPIRDRHGVAVAAINVSVAAGGSVEETVRRLRDPLLHTAAEIERDLRILPRSAEG